MDDIFEQTAAEKGNVHMYVPVGTIVWFGFVGIFVH
jgi:hypothetical protein